MRFPKPWLLLVGDSLWQIRFKRRLAAVTKGKRETVGLYEPAEQTVFIKAGMDLETTLATLVHEFFHILEDECGIEIGHKIINKIDRPIAKLILANFI